SRQAVLSRRVPDRAGPTTFVALRLNAVDPFARRRGGGSRGLGQHPRPGSENLVVMVKDGALDPPIAEVPDFVTLAAGLGLVAGLAPTARALLPAGRPFHLPFELVGMAAHDHQRM